MIAKLNVALRHSAFIIQHSALLFDFHVEHRRVVVFAERLVRVVLPRLVVVLEEDERHLLEGDRLSAFAVTLDVGFGEAFHAHHLEHHGEVEVDVEEILLPLDADDRRGVKLEILDFNLFHGLNFSAKMRNLYEVCSRLLQNLYFCTTFKKYDNA